MARIGFLDGDLNFVEPTRERTVTTKKKKKKEETPATTSVSQTVTPTQTVKTMEINNNNGNKLDKKDNKKKNVKAEKKQTIGDAISNSAVKNYGFNLSNAITDIANLADAAENTAESIPGFGLKAKGYKMARKTAGNVATNMAEGALGTLEGIGDWATSINPTDAVSAWAIEKIYGKKKANEFKKEAEKNTKNYIKRNLTDEFKEATGFNDIKNDWEKDSLVKSENIGGQVAQGVGGMVPSLVAGQYLGLTPKMTSKEAIKGLQGLSKAKAIAGNVGKDFISKLPSNAILGASSYGSGVQEALQDEKVSLDQAKKFGLANMASEIGTEYLTGGLPGLQGTGGLDYLADAGIDKLSKGYIKDLLKFGYQGLGEGLEEKANTYLTALAKQNILNQEQDWKQVEKESNQAALLGALTGSILNSPSFIQDVQTTKLNKNQSTAQTLTPMEKVQNLDPVQREALSEVTNKLKRGEPINADDNAVIGSINSSIDAQRSQNYADNLQLPQQTQQTQPQTVQNQAVQSETTQPNMNNQVEQNVAQTGLNEQQNINQINRNTKLENRVSGDTLLDAQDFINEVKNVGAKVDDNGYVTLYHQTTPENAKKIMDSGKMSSKENAVYFSTSENASQSEGRGNVKLEFKVPAEQLQLDDIFDDNADVKINMNGAKDIDISNYLVRDNQQNIPAMKEDNVITVRNKKGQELKLKQDKNNSNIYEKEIKVPKDNKSIVPKETMQKQLAKLKDGTKVSNFYSNITENSKFITQENMDKLSQEEIWKYAPQTNKETMQNAAKKIGDTQKSLESSYAEFLSKSENFTPEDVAEGWIYLKRFQDAGNYEGMVQVAKKMRNIATKSGQTVQMFNIQSRLTPEGMVRYAQSELMDAEQEFNKGKSQKEIDKYAKDFELTGDEIEFIQNQMEKIQGMEDGRQKNIEMAKINKMLSDKLPHKRGDSIKAWMRMSMLFNPKTQVRNIVGNALITPINAVADIPGAIVDKAISKKTGTRTIGAPSLGGIAEYGKGFVRGGQEALQDYKMGIDTKDVDMSRFDITQGKPFVENHKGVASVLNPVSKGLNKANNLLDLVMSGGDRVFYQGAFDASLRNQMKLNNVDTPTQDMIDIATQEALSRTWNDNNGYTQFVLNTRRGLNKLNVKGYGLGDVLIPFAKTPANLTKAIVDYSPAGLAKSIFDTKEIKNAIETGQITSQMQHDFAQRVGKGVAGTMLYGLAYALAKAGISSGSSDDDKDVADFVRNTLGVQPYSIKIGDKSFTYDWAQPVAAPLAIVSDAYKNLSRESDEKLSKRVFNTILDVGNTGFNVLLEQSFLQGISEVLNNNEGVANGIMEQIMGLPARSVPTFLQQITNMFDTTQRVSFEKDEPFTTSKQQIIAKTLFSKDLAPKVDSLGNEVEKFGGDKNMATYAIKNFLSPANYSKERTSKAAEEIYKVYEATGDKTVMPMVAPYYVQNKTVGRIDFNSKDRAKYQKISGKIVNDAVEELSTDTRYKNMTDEEKAYTLTGIVTYANAKAKEELTGYMANTYKGADKKINSGMSIADYYLSRTRKR